MNRIRAWIVRRLSEPVLGEIRRFKGDDWLLHGYTVNWNLDYGTPSLIFTYIPATQRWEYPHEQDADQRA